MDKAPYDGPILEIDRLSISFFTRLREIPAVMNFRPRCNPVKRWELLANPVVVNPLSHSGSCKTSA
jgi:hypothetical protein